LVGSDSLNPLSIIWDVLFTSEGVEDRGTTDVMLVAMNEQITNPIREVQNWNTLHKGQKVARAGFTSGLRFIIDISHSSVSEISKLNDVLSSFDHPLCAISIVSISETLSLPMDPQTKSRFPEIGRMMISVEFTNGLGYTDASGIRSALSNQTKDTKNGLDPISTGKGSSGKLFSEEFRSIMSDSSWFRRFTTFDGVKAGLLSGAAMGGSYDFSFDFRGAISELTDISEGTSWEKLDPDELTLTPSLIVDPTDAIESNFDPANFYHLSANTAKLIENASQIEIEQTGNSGNVEDIEYDSSRLIRGRRIRRQVGVDQGLAHGNESFVISNHVIRPWFADEFVNCLAFFLMTRKPKYWRNGKSTIQLIQPFSIDLIEALKEPQ
jgi:hypothetical protein